MIHHLRLLFYWLIAILSLMAHTQAFSQDPLNGNYTANYNGDNLYLSLEQKSGSTYSGVMEDSYQTYTVTLRLSGNKVSGTAIESSMDLHFDVVGKVQGDQLSL